jgi:diguanylate cyclase (GGDEF)-like protein
VKAGAAAPGASSISATALTHPRDQRRAGLAVRVGRWLIADVHAALALALGVPVVLTQAVAGFDGAASILALTVAYFCLQVMIGMTVGGAARGLRGTARFVLAVAFIAILTLLEPRTLTTVPILYVPVITLASATSLRNGITVALAAAAASRITMVVELGPSAAVGQSILPIVVVGFLAYGTRQVIASLERSLERVRQIAARDRRRSRRLRAIEGLGRLLAQEGPSARALETIMDVLVGTFGHRYTSVYLWEGNVLRLGAQRGYDHPIEEFDLALGIIGRVARTRRAAFVADVTRDPDYATADSAVTSEIAVPLLSGDLLLGVLNVESTAAERLDHEDLASLLTIADRLAASIALGQERTKLTERAALLGRLTEAFAALGATLDPVSLHAAIAEAATSVVACDIGMLTLAAADGAYRITAARGLEAIIGMTIAPGEGATGRAIESRSAILDDHIDREQYPQAARRVLDAPAVAVMAIPMIRDDATVGAITFLRRGGDHGFTEQERAVAALLTAQATLAVANAELHAETREAAVRDPLTSLHNRRFLDDSLTRMSAARERQEPSARRPLAAILFDLDHFGDLNNRHGHLVGDAVLRAFAGLLDARFRASDLVARYGGEEFLVVLDGASRDDAVRAAEEIRVAFRELDVAGPGGETFRATVSGGCAALDPSIGDLNVMIEVADVGLAMAKSAGRDQVVAA